jgi:NAD(P)-dependent dehydrogenase (short-subunit alcohol dehydrogenase family)
MTAPADSESTPAAQAAAGARTLFDLTGRVALVTGGATHLGRAMATALAAHGAHVVIASRRAELCEQVAAELRDEGLDVAGAGVDVTREDEVEALVQRIAAEQGSLDVLVANAGGSMTRSYLPNASLDEFRQTYELNVTSTYLCAQAAARVMILRRRGKIIAVGSIHGSLSGDLRLYEGLPFKRSGPPYQAAKGAVINLTRALAADLGEHNIQVNCISPGQIPKPETDPEFVERCRQNNALRRTGRPEDLQGAAVLLASSASDWITGQNLVVDGGWSIW